MNDEALGLKAGWAMAQPGAVLAWFIAPSGNPLPWTLTCWDGAHRVHPASYPAQKEPLQDGIDKRAQLPVPIPIVFQPWLKNYGTRHC